MFGELGMPYAGVAEIEDGDEDFEAAGIKMACAGDSAGAGNVVACENYDYGF